MSLAAAAGFKSLGAVDWQPLLTFLMGSLSGVATYFIRVVRVKWCVLDFKHPAQAVY